MGKILYEGAWRYLALTPTNLTNEKAIGSFLSGDDLRFPVGSASLNSGMVTENWNATQMTISVWIESLYFVPGDGLNHYVFANLGTDGITNRIRLIIDTAGYLNFTLYDKDSILHNVYHLVTDWTIGSSYRIDCVIDFNNDVIQLFVDNILEDDTPSNPLSSDSIDAIESEIHFGSDSSTGSQLNGAATIQICNVVKDATWVSDQWNSGNGVAFVVDSDTILMARFSKENTGIVYHHSGQKISSISTVTLTMAEAVGSRWVVGGKVLAHDDDDPANTVYTEIVSASGSEVEVADSCAALTGTNKYLSYNLLIDSGMESTGVANITAGANQVITKDGTVKFKDGQSLKDVFAAADDADESTIWTIICVSGEDYVFRYRYRIDAIHASSNLFIDIDGTATPILSRQLDTGTDDKGISYALSTWLYHEVCFQADQVAITVKLRITGAGAGTNSATAYLEDAGLRVNMIENGGLE